MPRQERLTLGCVGTAMLLVGLIPLLLVTAALLGELNFYRNGVDAEGRVLRTYIEPDPEGDRYYVIYRFVVGDQRIEAEDAVSAAYYSQLSEGDPVRLRYLANNPRSAQLRDASQSIWSNVVVGIIALAVSAIFGGAGLLFLWGVVYPTAEGKHPFLHRKSDFPLRDVITDEATPAKPINLAKRLDFDSNDLAYNQQGQLSPKQQRRLARLSIATYGCILLFLAVIAGFLSLATRDLFGQTYGWGVWLVGVVLVAGFILSKLRPHLHELRPPSQLHRAEGVVTKQRLQPRDESDQYFLQVGQTRLQVDYRAFHSFVAGQPYIIYYVDFMGQQMPLTAEEINAP